jgi:hypothetical protein
VSEDGPLLALRAVDQIRDALATLSYCSDGHFEDEAQVALDALDWLEDHLGLNLLRQP